MNKKYIKKIFNLYFDLRKKFNINHQDIIYYEDKKRLIIENINKYNIKDKELIKEINKNNEKNNETDKYKVQTYFNYNFRNINKLILNFIFNYNIENLIISYYNESQEYIIGFKEENEKYNMCLEINNIEIDYYIKKE